MIGLYLLSLLARIATSVANLLFAISFLGILWTTFRSAWRYRQTGWQIAIALAILTPTMFLWTTAVAWLFEELGFVVPIPPEFYDN